MEATVLISGLNLLAIMQTKRFESSRFRVEMMISDAHIGLQNAIARFFDGAAWQRCRFHFMMNFIDKIHSKEEKAEFTRLMRIVYEQKSKTQALVKAGEVAEYLRKTNLYVHHQK